MGKLKTAFRILRHNGLLALLDQTICRVRSATYVWAGRSYGLREALLFPDGFQIDLWTRYSRVAAALARHMSNSSERWRILEIGSAGSGLGGFMRDPLFWRRADLTVADHNINSMISVRRSRAVATNALALPFSSDSFDAVLAVDLLEHLPSEARERAAEEMKRVARRIVICHCPTQGKAKDLQGEWADLQFNKEFQRRFRRKPPDWVGEHLAAGHPSAEELSSLFPGGSLSGDQNCDVWLRYMLAGVPETRLPWRFLTGLRYLFSWAKQDMRTPFRSALVVFEI